MEVANTLADGSNYDRKKFYSTGLQVLPGTNTHFSLLALSVSDEEKKRFYKLKSRCQFHKTFFGIIYALEV
jgi:hypothetical protein